MKTKHYILFIFISLVFFSCQKTKITSYTGEKLKLNVTNNDGKYQLSWNKISSEDFVRYDIFISNAPIPDPKPNVSFENNVFKLTSISDPNKNTFTDSLNIFLENAYYRVFAVLKDRTITSNEYNSASNNTIINSSFSYYKFIPEMGLLYLFSSTDQVTIYNYLTNEIVVENKQLNTSRNYYFNTTCFSKYNNENNLAIQYYTGSSSFGVEILDPLTFTIKKSIPFGTTNSIYGTTASDKYVYTLIYNSSSSNYYTIKCYDIATGSLVSQNGIGNSSFGSGQLFITKNKNMLYAVSSNGVVNYSINSATGILTPHDSTSFGNFYPYYFKVSSDGTRFVSYNDGTLYDKDFNTVGQVTSTTGSNTAYEFVNNDNHILVAYNDFFNGGTSVDIFSIPSNNFVKTITANNSNTGSSFFMQYDGTNIICVFPAFDQISGKSITVIKRIPTTL